jgi:hypothetical protein
MVGIELDVADMILLFLNPIFPGIGARSPGLLLQIRHGQA